MRFSTSLITSAAIVALGEAATLRVDVGLNGLIFTPNSTAAAAGDVVEFHFHPKNHSVVQSSFDSPCNFGNLPNPINSGFIPVSSGESASVFQVTVNDTNPIWFYCSQFSHCQGGMVAVINEPASGNTLAIYAANAQKSSSSSTPATVEGGVVAQDSSNSTSVSTSAVSSSTAPASTAGGSTPSGSGSTTASAASATPTKGGAVTLEAVSWKGLLGMGAVIGGAAFLMQ